MYKERITPWRWLLSPRIIKWASVLALTVLVVTYLLRSYLHHGI